MKRKRHFADFLKKYTCIITVSVPWHLNSVNGAIISLQKDVWNNLTNKIKSVLDQWTVIPT